MASLTLTLGICSQLKRLGNGSFSRPASFKPAVKSVKWKSSSLSPLGNAKSQTVKFYKSIIVSIALLLFSSGPFTVFRPAISNTLLTVSTPIAPFIVYPINRMFIGWGVAHIRGESFDAFPALADCNVFSSIASIASANSSIQYCVPSTSQLSSGKPVRDMRGRSGAVSTRRCITDPNTASYNHFFSSAVTPKKPESVFISVKAFKSNSGQFVVFLVDDVFYSAHEGIIA